MHYYGLHAEIQRIKDKEYARTYNFNGVKLHGCQAGKFTVQKSVRGLVVIITMATNRFTRVDVNIGILYSKVLLEE